MISTIVIMIVAMVMMTNDIIILRGGQSATRDVFQNIFCKLVGNWTLITYYHIAIVLNVNLLKIQSNYHIVRFNTHSPSAFCVIKLTLQNSRVFIHSLSGVWHCSLKNGIIWSILVCRVDSNCVLTTLSSRRLKGGQKRLTPGHRDMSSEPLKVPLLRVPS